MTIKEIDEQLEIAANADILRDGTTQYWDLLPRVPFPELPDRYKKEVRKRFTVEDIHAFLIECYTPVDFEETVLNMTEEQKSSLPFPPEEYISFATVTKDIPANTLKKLIIKARNSAIYTIEAKDEPRLYGNHAREAFERILDEYEKSSGIQPAGKKSRRTIQKDNPKAEDLSKLVSAGYYQLVISDDKYKHALTPQKNKTAYIAIIDPKAFDGLTIQNGYLRLDNEIMGRFGQYIKGKYEDISKIDLPLLIQCYTAAFKALHSSDSYTITVYQPQFFQEMDIDIHGSKSADIMKKITAFRDLWGYLVNDNTLVKVFDLIEINEKKQTMTFAAPYMIRLWEKLDDKNHIERKRKNGELISYDKPYHNKLVHSTIANEKNKPAVELVYLMTNALFDRGFVEDVKTYKRKQTKNISPESVTYSITFRTLLKNAPLLRNRIDSYSSISDKNRALRRAFEKAYYLLETKTDAQKYFCNLQWQTFIPTMSTLDAVLTFTHEGKNGKYERHI